MYKHIQNPFFFLVLLITCFSSAQAISVHDPVMIKQKDTYYLYCTGRGISVFSSTDLKIWNKEPAIFQDKPIWVDSVVPNFDNHIWAPDISFHNNTYYVYYSASAFAKNTSAIGVTTNTTWDLCCRSEKSTSKVGGGRSKIITSPYVDKEGKPLTEGGGTLLIQGDKNWYGAGHNSTHTFDSEDYIIFHAYNYEAKRKTRTTNNAIAMGC